jgi:transposase
MLKSRTVNRIHDLDLQGKSVQEIAQELEISRTTVRKYLRNPEKVIPKPRRPRASKLDGYRDQIRQWVEEDHCTNCEVLLVRLQKLGYRGGISILKGFVHHLRPGRVGQTPVQRYETQPGEQLQFDWGEFPYEQEGIRHKVYGFAAILGYSRMRYVTFVKRCDTSTLIRCLMGAFEYFGGLTKVVLTDRMKSVLLEMEEKKPKWNAQFTDFITSVGVTARVCKAYTPQTKGKIERTISYVKTSFWAGVTFTDLDDVNRQAHAWCERINARVHRTTHQRPMERWEEESLHPLPKDFAWERFATEERKVSWDGYLSYDGVLYGVPGPSALAGKTVQVRERKGMIAIWSEGNWICEYPKHPHSQEIVSHPHQWDTIPSVSATRTKPAPQGHLRPQEKVVQRSLQEYSAGSKLGQVSQ